MIINTKKPILRTVAQLWVVMVPVATYIAVVAWLDLKYHFEVYKFPIQMLSIFGTVIGILLAFRTNSCYGRWWEARILWGGIVNDSRTWVRQILVFCDPVEQGVESDFQLQQMAHRQVALCLSLSRSLRGQDPFADLASLLDDDVLSELKRHTNVPNAILLRHGIELRRLYEEGRLDSYRFCELEQTLRRLTDRMGGCERIKNTPFPTSYAMLVHALVYLFILALPIGLTQMPSAALFATALTSGLGFLIVERIAIYLQDPFANQPSDTPMLGLSRTIEINIRQMLKEAKIPDPLKPVDGILY